MVDVGRVVTHREIDTDYYRSSYKMLDFGGLDPPRTYTDKEWATVRVGPEGVDLSPHIQSGGDLRMTPGQAIELAQLLMKAAESQAEYAKARRALQEEMVKLDETFKDRISGLGIGGIEEPKGPRMVAQGSDVIIVDAG